MPGSKERWERRWAEGRELVRRMTDEELTESFTIKEEATPRNIELSRKLMSDLGGPPAQPARQRQLYAGLRYVAEHREEIVREYSGEWIAANQQGIVAHAYDPDEVREQLTPMRRNPRFAAHIQFSELPYTMIPATLIQK